ncbi:MAG: hypothetical protein AAGJ56_03120 [Myxococcota bacterium]
MLAPLGAEQTRSIPPENLRSFRARLVAGAAALKLAQDPCSSLEHWLEHWARPIAWVDDSETSEPEREARDIRRAVIEQLPCLAELVVGLRDERTTLAWLSGGRGGSDLAESVSGLLHASLSAHLSAGGDRPRAERMAAIFAATFPNLERLRSMSGLAPMFLVGVAPGADGDVLKLYLNPRLSGGDTIECLREMACAADIDSARLERLARLLYLEHADVSTLYGVGIDLRLDAPARFKFYVRVEAERMRSLCGGFDPEIQEPLEEVVSSLRTLSRIDQVELAAAWDGDQLSAKVTQFWDGRRIERSEEAVVLEWLDNNGTPSAALNRVFTAMRAPKTPALQRSPLRAFGVELGQSECLDGARAKSNLYLQPEL